MKITAVLLLHRRWRNFKTIMDSLLAEPLIQSVKVWFNPPDQETMAIFRELVLESYRDAPLDVMFFTRNLYTLGRFKAAMSAPTQIVGVQDDDVLVENWGELVDEFCRRNWRHVVCNLDGGHKRWSEGGRYEHETAAGPVWETLLGWGAVFQRRWCRDLHRYKLAMELDDYDELLMRKADRIFTMLRRRPHVEIERRVRHLAGAQDEHALYQQRRHWAMNQDAVEGIEGYMRRVYL
jgi:hypothetical protein